MAAKLKKVAVQSKPQKRLHKAPIAEPEVQAIAPVVKEEPAAPVKEDFWADPKREEALKLIMFGMPKQQVAKQLDVHRNTINNWCADTRFIAALNQRMNEHKAATRVRRLRATNTMNDKIERVTMALLTDVEETLKIDKDTGKPNINDSDREKLGKGLRLFREMNFEFRETREQERKDYGDDIKKVAVNQQTTITGDVNVQHHGVNDTPFADYVRKAMHDKAIDAVAIELPNNAPDGALMLKAAEHVLMDTDFLDKLAEEDKMQEEMANG
jgi:hypothetical protein